MENRIVIVDVQTPTATPTESTITSLRREEKEILSFSESTNMDPEWLLPEILNDDDLIINESWCDTVRELIQKQPEKHTRNDWIEICLQLVEIIQNAKNRQVPTLVTTETMACPLPEFQRESHLIFDQSDDIRAVETSPIPFRVGLQLLQGSEPDIGEQTREAVRGLENEAMTMEAAILDRGEEEQLLRQRLTHWKILARVRLIEMRRDLEYQQSIVFGSRSKIQVTEAI
jgi:hypothetical protein